MFKCRQCIFYNEEGYRDMGTHIPDCKFIMVEEQRKKNRKEKYDLFKALINDESIAETCNYFTYICEAVDIIKERIK